MRTLFLCLMLACLPLYSIAADNTIVIAAVGDSLFAGFGVERRDSFPNQLETRLKTEGFNVNILNFGISGDTTAGGIERIGHIAALKPDLVLLELGANDMLHGVAPQEVHDNLEKILSSLHKADIKILVLGQSRPLVPSKAYDSLFCDLAKKYDAPCYPFFLKKAFGHPELMQPDRLHPNPQGVKAIMEDTYPLIARLVKDTAAAH